MYAGVAEMAGKAGPMKRLLRENGLSVTVVATFLVIWFGGQTVAGLHSYNVERRLDGEQQLSFGEYLSSAHFGEATFENWESEFLQMGMYVLLTVKLVQRGSAESRPVDEPVPQDEDPAAHRQDPGAPWPVRRGASGWRCTGAPSARCCSPCSLCPCSCMP